MAVKKLGDRTLFEREREKEKTPENGYFVLPTFEELQEIEQTAKEDAAKAVSSGILREQEDLGRRSFAAFGEKKNALQTQIGKIEKAKQEYEAYPLIDRIGIGSAAKMADIAKDEIKRQETVYDRMRKTDETFEREHKADLGETLDRMATSAGYGIAKSFGSVADTTKAIGAGVAAGFENFASEKFSTAYNRAYQESLTDGESLYEKIDAEYQRERERADKTYGTLNVFTNYVDMAAHSAGEQAFLFWASSMATALAGGATIFSAIGSAADDLIAGGGKIAKAAGKLLKKVDAGTVGGAIAMYTTASAQATKEAVTEMNNINAGREAFGQEPKYTQEEIEHNAALYGVLGGLSESVLEYALGGLTGAKKASETVKNPMLTALLGYVKGSLGEGMEEMVQSLASYGLKRAIYDENAQLDWQEVIDSGIVGTITGFGMGLPSAVQNTRAAADVQKTVHYVAREANNAATDSERVTVMLQAEALAQSSAEIAQKMREDGSEGAETIADIYEWQAKQAETIAKAIADIANSESGGTESAQDARGDSADTKQYDAETERTGRESGAGDASIRFAQEVSAAVGIPVRFYREAASGGTVRNGYFHDGAIYINTASKNTTAQIVSHELTHSIEADGSYQRLQNLVLRRMMDEGTDMEAAYREKEMLYTKAGIELRSADDIAHELVAEYMETRLLTDRESIASLVREDRTLGQRIRAWLDSVLARLGNASAKERDFVRQARDLYAEALGEGKTAESGSLVGTRYSLTGVNENGIEVYETSSETKALSWGERKKKYLDLMRGEYQGRTAKFERNGHVYYAQYDPKSLRKPIYGDDRSSPNGVKALIKAGADGDIFNLVENSKYKGSAVNTKNHTDADYFDYFVKTVQIDGKVFDLMADVEKNNNVDGGYVYTLALVDNKKIKASPAHGTPTVPVNNAGNASDNSISQNGENVNREFSVSEEQQTDDNDIRYSISPSFETEIDAWDQKTEGFSFVVGNTSEALQKAGISKKQIRMDATKIKKLLDKHSGMSIEIIKQIPQLLEEPVIVIDSKQDDNSKIVMGELYDENGKPVTAVLLLAPTSRGGNVLDMIKISSAEGRGHIGSLFRKEDGTPVEVRYVDEKRIRDWLNVNRLQLPLRNLGLDSDNSISQVDENVKRQFSVSEDTEGRQLSDAQKEYFKDSKVVDNNGNLKVMYHGTQGGDFTVFDKKKAKSSGTFGRGFYFSDSKSHAGQYGNTFEVYLNIKNPLQGGTKTMTEDQIRSFVEAVAENEDYGLDNYGYEATVDSVVNSLYGKSDFEIMMDVNLTCIGNMAEALELFNEVNGTAYDGIITPMETVVFKPEQIKNVDNTAPTNDPDIRYSVSEDDSDKRVMPKRSAAGTKARARQDQKANMQLEQKVMRRGLENLSEPEQRHYREEMGKYYRKKYDEYKKRRDDLVSSGYEFADTEDYAKRVVGGVEEAAMEANEFLVHFNAGVFGDPASADVQAYAMDYLEMLGAYRPDTGESGAGEQGADALAGVSSAVETEVEDIDVESDEAKLTRKVLHKNIMDGIKEEFSRRGLDLDKVLAKAKDLSTFATVDNTPQRVMEKSLGYQAGQALSDLTVNRVAENETAGIRWLNQYTSRDGVIAGLAKKYNIKPGSKESAAAQMYAEGFYVNEYDEIVEYGDRELAADFPDAHLCQ